MICGEKVYGQYDDIICQLFHFTILSVPNDNIVREANLQNPTSRFEKA